MRQTPESEERKKTFPSWNEVEILIVGAGLMGASLAQNYAQNGFTVGLLDLNRGILEKALARIRNELEAGLKKGIFSASKLREIEARILTTTDYRQALTGAGLRLVIETATEDIEVKKQIFRTLDRYCGPQVVLASNTSSLDINILASQTSRPDKVVWMHFFYLPHKNRAGEYAGAETASSESVEIAARYMKLGGKTATPILKSRKGGAADIIFVALLLEAARMVDEGFEVCAVEEAAKRAFSTPVGFLSLMDANGIPLAYAAMKSFSDSSNPDDPLYRVYDNFFTPPESIRKLMEVYEKAGDRSAVRWVSEEQKSKKPADEMEVDILKNRFLAVAFMTATEVVEAGVVEMDEVEKLCQTAFMWQKGPFSLMNLMGVGEALRIVTQRMELSHRNEINFPVPQLLIKQAQKSKPWPLELSSVLSRVEKGEKIARVMISSPSEANALDDRVMERLGEAFSKAEENERIKVIIFDTAPIKTFISGFKPGFLIREIRLGNFRGLRQAAERWQDIVFHRLTGGKKPRIAIVDGLASGAGAEIALAFALDPNSIVIITDRTSYLFPEVGLGIYPFLRATLTLPWLLYLATGEEEKAISLSRYYLLSGKEALSSAAIRKFGLADFLVPARRRDEVADLLAGKIMEKSGKVLSGEEYRSLGIEELAPEISAQQSERLELATTIFSPHRSLSDLENFMTTKACPSLSGKEEKVLRDIALQVVANSPHALEKVERSVIRGFEGLKKGKSLDEFARYELEQDFLPVMKHLDALEGLSAFLEGRKPSFSNIIFSWRKKWI
ncbi:MAG: 3-hydroxyacyl-CoA dehydrogenase/enoyl-CoA hydratase family protein [Candidatus Aminicenantales bacterium]